MKWIKVPSLVFFAALLVVFISACDGSGGDTVAPTLETPTATVVPGNTATINGTTSIVVTFSDTMSTTSLALGGTMAAESDGGTWSDATNVNDTLTIAPTSSWSNGAQTLTFSAVNNITAELPTVTLNYTVDAVLPVASILPTNGSTITGIAPIIITFTKTMDITTLVASGSVQNQGDGGVWSATTNLNDTLTISPKNLWKEGTVNLTLGIVDLVGNAVALNLNYPVAAYTCSDSIQNQDETDIDCGGTVCSSCADGDSCTVNTDCSSNTCTLGVCAPCTDTDGDGVCDALDFCPLDNPDDTDTDTYCDSDDCNPLDSAVNPGATEICNGVDDNCSGNIDDGLVLPSAPCEASNAFGTCVGTWACGGASGWICDAQPPTAAGPVCP